MCGIHGETIAFSKRIMGGITHIGTKMLMMVGVKSEDIIID